MAELQALNDPTPLFSDTPLYGSGELSPFSSTKKEPDLSGSVKAPGFLELLPSALGGPAGVENKYNRIMAERAAPVVSKLMQAGNDALQNNDFETANKVVLGLSNLSSSFPHFSKLVESYTTALNAKKNKIEQNNAVLDVFLGQAKGNDELQQLGGALKSAVSKIEPERFQKLLETSMPTIVSTPEYTEVISKFTGKSSRELKPGVLTPQSLTPEQNAALELAGVDKARFLYLGNKVSSGKDMPFKEAAEFLQMKGLVDQKIAEALGQSRLPVAAGLPLGVTNQNRPALTQTGGVPQVPSQQGIPQQVPQGLQQQVPQAPLRPPQQQPIAPPLPQLPQQSQLPSQGQQRLTVEDAVKYFPVGTSKKQIQKVLEIPALAEALSTQFAKDQAIAATQGKAQSPEAAALANRTEQLAKEDYAKTAATQQAEAEYKGMGPQESSFYMDELGNVVKEPRNLTKNQAAALKMETFSQPTQQYKAMQDYQGLRNVGKAAFTAISTAPPEALATSFDGNALRAINTGLAKGIQIPIRAPWVGTIPIGIPGVGAAAMSLEQVKLYNKIVPFAQAAEEYLKGLGKDSQEVALVKSALTGIFTNKDLALITAKSLLETAKEQVKGNFLVKGSVRPQVDDPELRLPNMPVKGGVTESVGSQSSAIASQASKVLGVLQGKAVEKGKEALSTADKGAASISQAVKDLRNSSTGKQIIEYLQKNIPEALRPTPGRKRPVNSEVERVLKGLNAY